MLEWNFFRKSKNFINNTLNLFWLLAFLAFGVTVGIAYLGPQTIITAILGFAFYSLALVCFMYAIANEKSVLLRVVGAFLVEIFSVFVALLRIWDGSTWQYAYLIFLVASTNGMFLIKAIVDSKSWQILCGGALGWYFLVKCTIEIMAIYTHPDSMAGAVKNIATGTLEYGCLAVLLLFIGRKLQEGNKRFLRR